MSDFGLKADMASRIAKCPLMTQSGLVGRIINNPPRLYCILNNIIVDGQQKWHQLAYLVDQ
jgi:hypothetical protein